jgi:hypothetical protein
MKKITRVTILIISVETFIMTLFHIYLTYTRETDFRSDAGLYSTIFWSGIFILHNARWAWWIFIISISIVILLLQFPSTFIDTMGNLFVFSDILPRYLISLFYSFVLVILLLDNPKKWNK